MIECGLPADKLVVKGNFVSRSDRNSESTRKDQVVYVGRLSDEKGIRTLIKAWKMMGGGGVNNGKIEFVGAKSKREVRQFMAEARCVVLPSEWWETFGLTVVEAMSEGTPVVVSDNGALPEIVK